MASSEMKLAKLWTGSKIWPKLFKTANKTLFVLWWVEEKKHCLPQHFFLYVDGKSEQSKNPNGFFSLSEILF